MSFDYGALKLVEPLLKPKNKDQLVAILTYHVVPRKVISTDLKDDVKAATVQVDARETQQTDGDVNLNI